MRRKVSRRQLRRIINEEMSQLHREGFFKNVAAVGSRFIPGGGMALDYMRSKAFERIECI